MPPADLQRVREELAVQEKPVCGHAHFAKTEGFCVTHYLHNVRMLERFAPLKTEPLRVLEIGIERGGSLLMWRDYFPNAQVFGIDITDKTGKVVYAKVSTTHGGRAPAKEILSALAAIQ